MTERAATWRRTFRTAAADLGFATASRLFLREAEAASGAEGLRAVRDALGDEFPVLAALADGWSSGATRDLKGLADARHLLRDARTLLFVGVEADAIDALLTTAPDARGALLTASTLGTDWERVLANYRGRLAPVGIDAIYPLAGARSAIVVPVYGRDDHAAAVEPTWRRIRGGDVRARFRTVLGWDQLGAPLGQYPRYLVEVPPRDFSEMIG